MKHRRSARSVSCVFAALLLFGCCASGSGEGEDAGGRAGQSQTPSIPGDRDLRGGQGHVRGPADGSCGEMLGLMLNSVRSDGVFLCGDSGYICDLWQYVFSPQGFAFCRKAWQKMTEKTVNAVPEKLDALEGE